jgi:hypothetical protein
MNIFKDGVLVDVDVSFWSGAKVLTAEDLGLKAENVADAYKLGRKLLIPKAIIKRFRAIEGRARRVVQENSFQFPIGNARFIPKRKFAKALESLKKYQADYNTLVDDLVANYESYRSQMIPIYQQAAEQAFATQEPSTQVFSIEDREQGKTEFVNKFLARIQEYYPSADSLRQRFSLSWDVYEIAFPKMRKSSGENILAAEEQKMIAEEEYRLQAQQKISGFIDEVVGTLRQETSALCNRIITNIKEGKVIKGRTLNSIRDFIDKFSDLNFVGDQKIEEELATLKKDFLDTHSLEQISEEKDLQDELHQRLESLSKTASDMTDINSVTGEYRRKIDWD